MLAVVVSGVTTGWCDVSAHPVASEATRQLGVQIERAPDDPLLHVERARQWRLQGLPHRARKDLAQALRHRPNLAAAHHEWALLELAGGDDKRALHRLNAAVEAAPRWWRPRQQRGRLLLRQGQGAAAVEDMWVTLAERGSPDDFAAAAEALVSLARPEDAATLLREGAEGNGSVVLAMRAMSSYRDLGWYGDALLALDFAERLGADPFAVAIANVELGMQMGEWNWACGEASRREEALHALFSRRATNHRRERLRLLEGLREDAESLCGLAPRDHAARACLPSDKQNLLAE